MTNREIGLVWMAYILAQLYDNWPGKVIIEMSEAIEATGTQPEGPEEVTAELWRDLGQWLENEGIIRKGSAAIGEIFLDDAVLTARGFELLGKPTLGAEKALGSQLGDLATSTGTEAAKAGAKKASDLVGLFLGNFVKGLAS